MPLKNLHKCDLSILARTFFLCIVATLSLLVLACVAGQEKAIVLIVKIVRRLLRSGPSGVRSWPCCSRR